MSMKSGDEKRENDENDENDENEKTSYSQPKLTVHGDLRVITSMKASNMAESGRPRTWNRDNP
jgi:hypothetical protein